MINADTIEKMKNGVRVVNTARGKAIVEEDLARRSSAARAGLRDRRVLLRSA